MTGEERPAWLIRMENGVVAEARTRSLLLDRFWLLERSVDIEGADIIIQRRLTTRSLLDVDAPRLGFVQAKFHSSGDTTHYVHEEYVVDRQGKPRAEFFLVCHNGTEDSARSYFLTATDIVDRFDITAEDHSKPRCFSIPGSALLQSDRFLTLDRRRVLDVMERSLQEADLIRNRRFMSWALPRPPEEPLPVLQMYAEEIDNWWGDSDETLRQIEATRTTARHAQWDIEEVLEQLREIETTNDPIKGQEIAESISHEFGNHVRLPDLYDPDFQNVLLFHRRRYEQLDQAGLLNGHAALRRAVLDSVVSGLERGVHLEETEVYVISTRYEAETFRNPSIVFTSAQASSIWPAESWDSTWRYANTPDSMGILRAGPGFVELYLLPSYYTRYHGGIRAVARLVRGKICERILELRFGE
jgi:hypothetical protein